MLPWKASFEQVSFFVLITVSLLVRLYSQDYPLSNTFAWGDGARDYLVARHILVYHELPLAGPFNLLYENGIFNSPLYFYLLALVLIPADSILFLGIINVFFQIATIALLYFLAKNLFGKTTAFLSSLLFSFTPEILNQSDFIWQPHLMQPFALLSLLMLALSYLKKNYLFMLMGTISLSFTSTIHNSAFPLIPLYLALSFLILRSQKRKFSYFLGVLAAAILSLVIFYSPLFIYYLKTPDFTLINREENGLFVYSASNYFSNLIANISQLIEIFSLKNFLGIILILLTLAYFKIGKSSQRKKYLVITLLFLALPLIFASFFNKIRPHYVILSFGPFAIFIAEIVNSLLSIKFNRSYLLIGWLALAIFTFKTLSANFYFATFPNNKADNFKIVQSATNAVRNEVLAIKKANNYESFDFFQIASFANADRTFRYPILDTILLAPLERQFQKKLSTVSDGSAYNHAQINKDDFVFIVCYEFAKKDLVQNCSSAFIQKSVNYSLVKHVHSSYPISVYLAKKVLQKEPI